MTDVCTVCSLVNKGCNCRHTDHCHRLFIAAQSQMSLPVTLNISPSLTPREFNSYGARRGNDAVMTRGTFASIKLQNRLIGKGGPKTLHVPSGQTVSVNVFRPEDLSGNSNTDLYSL